jgi:tetratricopeptide (TPR) repeat protein
MKRVIGGALALLAAGCVTGPPDGARNRHYLEQADKLFLLEQYSQAAGYYDEFLRDNPDHPERAEVRARAGRAHFGAGRPDLAVAAFDKALGESAAPPLRWEIQFRRAVALRAQGDFAKALEGFRAVVSAPPAERGQRVQNDELHYEYAIALCRSGDWKAGQAELAKVSPTGPKGREAQKRLGLAGFTVQVASFEDESRARAEAAKVKGLVRPIPNEKLFIVTAGTFPLYEEAAREAERLRRTYPEAFVLP